ncbi:MAG TPA: hypothetical protein VIS31_05430 [Woeseiaceae bacterium]
MNKKDEKTMEAHGITCVQKNQYLYEGFKYDRLADAVRYAEIVATRLTKLGDPA